MSITPAHMNERSIFSYTPPTFTPSVEEIVSGNIDLKKDTWITDAIDCPAEIHCTLPDGIKIENRPYSNGESNYGLYATKFFKKHTIIYTKNCPPVRIDKDGYKLVIDPDGIEYQLDKHKHLFYVTDDIAYLPSFPTFINHSCDPSCYPAPTDSNREYMATALRDIQPNDEITMDYCLFNYDDKGFIEHCDCKMPSCRGSYHGFRYLSDYEKQKLLPYTEIDVQILHLMENKKLEQQQQDESEQHPIVS